MPGTWSPAPNPAPFCVGTVLLLTDGTLLAQDDSTVDWWRLHPTQAGDYAGGTWVKTARATRKRRFFASAVLADGHVLVAGGKYGDDPNTPADLPDAEIYDPVLDQWTAVKPPDSWGVLGDAPCCVLPNGTVLIGNNDTGQCALFDPAQNAWRPAATKRNRSTRGETWTLLPDGSVLAIDCNGHPASERYVDGEWRDEGAIPVDLVESASLDTGPAILRPDGTVVAFGATLNTAIFTPDPVSTRVGTWGAGTPMPQDAGRQLVAKDAPACLLPNGRILLLAAATGGAAANYGATSIPYEFDGAVFTPTAPYTQPREPRQCRLLVLPNGQVMLATGTTSVSFYTPDAPTPQPWFPAITQVSNPIAPGTSNLLRGQRLNGMSQACAFGDDASMATNYPLVRLTSKAAPKTVRYCRTFGHSTMGVATADGEHSTNFAVPDGVAVGEYDLEVVVNGIASPPKAVTVKLAPPAARAAASGATSYRNLDDDRALQEEMFWRDLNEVHLLMDYISGRSDKSLSDLKDVLNPDSTATNSAATLSAQDALQRVCLIRFPPEGSPEKKANDAALLLLVKDRLNALAAPARGLSVAFTAMFAGTAGASQDRPGTQIRRQLINYFWVAEPARRHVTGFAIASYPNLEATAAAFKYWFRFLPYLAIIWVILTAITSWDVAVSSQVLQRGAADRQVVDQAKVTQASCQITTSNGEYAFDPKATPSDACKALLRTLQPFTYADEQVRRAVFLGNWFLHPIGAVVHYGLTPPPGAASPCNGAAPAPPATNAAPQPAATCPPGGNPTDCTGGSPCAHPQGVWAFAGIIVAAFTNYVLPTMFGVLGTLAGVIRSIIIKVKDSTLSPRDVTLTISLIPLGAVAGLAVGLIVTPGNAQTGATALTLPAAGLAFVAGYGADAFFAMVDGLLTRVFAINATPSSGSK